MTDRRASTPHGSSAQRTCKTLLEAVVFGFMLPVVLLLISFLLLQISNSFGAGPIGRSGAASKGAAASSAARFAHQEYNYFDPKESFYSSGTGSVYAYTPLPNASPPDEPLSAATVFRLREQVRGMAAHALSSYMAHAYPFDEVKPLSCAARTWKHRDRGTLDDPLGGYSLTLVDSLSTLAATGGWRAFRCAASLLISDLRLDADVTVSVFEASIRVLGGLLSAHVTASDPVSGPFSVGAVSLRASMADDAGEWCPRDCPVPCVAAYRGELLDMAEELALRLLPAFDAAPSGIPFHGINLRSGEVDPASRETCTAAAGTFLLEWGLLSRLTGRQLYEAVARRASAALWKARSPATGLVGSALDAQDGSWRSIHTGIGAGVDSYPEYLLKSAIALDDDALLAAATSLLASISRHTVAAGVHVEVTLMEGRPVGKPPVVSALQAFYAGLEVLAGHVTEARSHLIPLLSLWRDFNKTGLPEAFDVAVGSPVHFAKDSPLRPELIESLYHYYTATDDPAVLRAIAAMVESIEATNRVPCGYASVADVTASSTPRLDDRMDSFVISETFKYAFLAFDTALRRWSHQSSLPSRSVAFERAAAGDTQQSRTADGNATSREQHCNQVFSAVASRCRAVAHMLPRFAAFSAPPPVTPSPHGTDWSACNDISARDWAALQVCLSYGSYPLSHTLAWLDAHSGACGVTASAAAVHWCASTQPGADSSAPEPGWCDVAAAVLGSGSVTDRADNSTLLDAHGRTMDGARLERSEQASRSVLLRGLPSLNWDDADIIFSTEGHLFPLTRLRSATRSALRLRLLNLPLPSVPVFSHTPDQPRCPKRLHEQDSHGEQSGGRPLAETRIATLAVLRRRRAELLKHELGLPPHSSLLPYEDGEEALPLPHASLCAENGDTCAASASAPSAAGSSPSQQVAELSSQNGRGQNTNASARVAKSCAVWRVRPALPPPAVLDTGRGHDPTQSSHAFTESTDLLLRNLPSFSTAVMPAVRDAVLAKAQAQSGSNSNTSPSSGSSASEARQLDLPAFGTAREAAAWVKNTAGQLQQLLASLSAGPSALPQLQTLATVRRHFRQRLQKLEATDALGLMQENRVAPDSDNTQSRALAPFRRNTATATVRHIAAAVRACQCSLFAALLVLAKHPTAPDTFFHFDAAPLLSMDDAVSSILVNALQECNNSQPTPHLHQGVHPTVTVHPLLSGFVDFLAFPPPAEEEEWPRDAGVRLQGADSSPHGHGVFVNDSLLLSRPLLARLLPNASPGLPQIQSRLASGVPFGTAIFARSGPDTTCGLPSFSVGPWNGYKLFEPELLATVLNAHAVSLLPAMSGAPEQACASGLITEGGTVSTSLALGAMLRLAALPAGLPFDLQAGLSSLSLCLGVATMALVCDPLTGQCNAYLQEHELSVHPLLQGLPLSMSSSSPCAFPKWLCMRTGDGASNPQDENSKSAEQGTPGAFDGSAGPIGVMVRLQLFPTSAAAQDVAGWSGGTEACDTAAHSRLYSMCIGYSCDDISEEWVAGTEILPPLPRGASIPPLERKTVGTEAWACLANHSSESSPHPAENCQGAGDLWLPAAGAMFGPVLSRLGLVRGIAMLADPPTACSTSTVLSDWHASRQLARDITAAFAGVAGARYVFSSSSPPSSAVPPASATLPVVAIVLRGHCNFVQKALHVQAAGADAILVVDAAASDGSDGSVHFAPAEFSMSGDGSGREPGIPAAFLAGAQARVLLTELRITTGPASGAPLGLDALHRLQLPPADPEERLGAVISAPATLSLHAFALSGRRGSPSKALALPRTRASAKPFCAIAADSHATAALGTQPVGVSEGFAVASVSDAPCTVEQGTSASRSADGESNLAETASADDTGSFHWLVAVPRPSANAAKAMKALFGD